jgi:hypothetical protein
LLFPPIPASALPVSTVPIPDDAFSPLFREDISESFNAWMDLIQSDSEPHQWFDANSRTDIKESSFITL